MKEWRFMGKIAVEGELEVLTGLHIGGGKEGYEIGGLDNPVIKLPLPIKVYRLEGNEYVCPEDSPYIPGSSIKGKMRAILEWLEEDEDEHPHIRFEQDKEGKGWSGKILNCDDPEEKERRENCHICAVFGHPAVEATKLGPTRLIVRDAYPTEETLNNWKLNLGEEGPYTELKWENTIDRLTSQANPRAMERIVPGSKFLLHFDYLIFKGEGRKLEDDVKGFSYLFKGLKALEENFLGGSGSRGYGRVKINGLKAFLKKREDYFNDKNHGEKLTSISGGPSEVLRNWKEVKKEILGRFKYESA